MGFEKHIFISYAHDDNTPLTGQEKGWITRFHDQLSDRLKVQFGPEVQRSGATPN